MGFLIYLAVLRQENFRNAGILADRADFSMVIKQSRPPMNAGDANRRFSAFIGG
jgi:hypothetical protein